MKKLADFLNDQKALQTQLQKEQRCQEPGCQQTIVGYCDCLMGLCEPHLKAHAQTQATWEREVADKLGVPLRQVRGFTVPTTGKRACEYEAERRAKELGEEVR